MFKIIYTKIYLIVKQLQYFKVLMFTELYIFEIDSDSFNF